METKALCEQLGIQLIAYSPLGLGAHARSWGAPHDASHATGLCSCIKRGCSKALRSSLLCLPSYAHAA